jgi:DNA-binding SARP family transcriptional activator/predicted ATPase
MSTIAVYLFGTPRLERDGALAELDTRKALALLAYLLLTGEPQARESLAALLWPEMDDRRARAALRRTLTPLRAGLGDGKLYATRDLVGLAPDAGIWCDVLVFREALGRVAAHHPTGELACSACQSALEQVIPLVSDDFMAGFSLRDSLPFDDWQLLQAETLRRQYAEALATLVELSSAQGAFDRAAQLARRWLALDPLREEAHRQLMRLNSWRGQRAAALQQYRECVRILEEELGVEPLPETTALYQQIQENRLPEPVIAPVAVTAPAPDASAIDEPAPTRATAMTAVALPLVGRDAERRFMDQIYGQVRPSGQLLAVIGEAGIGKSALSESFLTAAGAAGAPVLAARCYEGEATLAYAPLIQAVRGALGDKAAMARLAGISPAWLTELSRLVPELGEWFPDLPAPPPLEGPGGQTRFFTGLAEVLTGLCAGPMPGILFVDDAHWADSATLDLVTFLAHRLQGRPLLLLMTWRAAELPDTARLDGLLAAVERAGHGARLTLPRLMPEAVAELMRTTGIDDEATSLRLFEETEGLPFFVQAYLAAGASTEAPRESWPIPSGVRDLLLARLAAVSAAGQQLLQTAAAIGRAYDDDLLRAASGRSEEETVSGLEELLQHGLVRETEGVGGTAFYDFSHEKLRTVIYEETSQVRRRLLHRRLGAALADQARRRRRLSAEAGQIAEHLRQGGLDAEAADYYRQAGDHARSVAAHREALASYEMALALGGPEPGTLHEACGDLHVLLGEYETARRAYEAAAAQSQGATLARVEHRLGQVYQRQGEYGLAQSQFEAALAMVDAGTDLSWQAGVHSDWSLAAYQQRDLGGATARAKAALALAEAVGDERSLAQAHNMLGILARASGEAAVARAHLERSLALAQSANERVAEVAARNNLALLEGDAGQFTVARAQLEEALALCLITGDRHREAALRNNLADVLYRAGENEASLAQLKEAVAITAEIGGETATAQPEIWKLTQW